MSAAPQFSSVREFIDLLRSRSNFPLPSNPLPPQTPPIVSIISSFYNADRYFEETYRSIFYQTWQNFEWIIVDDASTEENAIVLLNSLPQRSPKIKTFKHPTNRGVSAGRNTAITHARGTYLFFIDLDDLIDPTYIEKCVLFLETHPDFSFVNAYSVGFQDQEYWWHQGFNQPSLFIQQNQVTGRLLYRKSDFERVGGFDETLRVYEDWERWLRAIVNNQKGWTMPEYLECYRRTDSGLYGTALKNPLKAQQEIELIQSRYQEIFKERTFSDINRVRSSFAPLQLNLSISAQNSLTSSANRRILCFFPFLEVGGADRLNLDLISLLTEQNNEIAIVTTLKSRHPWHQYFYEITPTIFHLSNFLEPNQWLAFTKYLIQSRSIDLVLISNCYIAYYFLPLLVETLPHVTFIDLTHTDDPGWRGNGYPRVSCQFGSFLDTQIVTSQFLASSYQTLSPAAAKKLKVCYTCINTEWWIRDEQKRQTLRSQLEIAEETVVCLFPARLVQQKRPLFLVELAKALTNYFQSFIIIILGEGELKTALHAKIEQLNLTPYFHLLPPVTPTKMLEFYAAADILLLPSAYEGISLAIYEAMSMQLPIVAADVGGQAELVTPDTGTLVPKGESDEAEIDAYIQALLPLLENPHFRQQQGERSRQRVVEWFGRDRLIEWIDTIFTEATHIRQTHPKPRLDAKMAEELLLIALEYQDREETLSDLWQQKCQLEAERHELAWKKRAMESSKFWQLRKLWFKLKRQLRLTDEEEI
ncbi:MAG: glycosyltransferase [Cyanobacteriota bacterium]|nr:glycosyltransferase [Cyanobacteriota bacterium]